MNRQAARRTIRSGDLDRREGPVGGWRVFEPGFCCNACSGGVYWEVFRGGVKVNGGLAPDRERAVKAALHQLYDRPHTLWGSR